MTSTAKQLCWLHIFYVINFLNLLNTMKALIFLLAIFFAVTTFAQNFEGTIVYQNSYKSKVPGVPDCPTPQSTVTPEALLESPVDSKIRVRAETGILVFSRNHLKMGLPFALVGKVWCDVVMCFGWWNVEGD